ncbi:MAG: HAMP domain-containing sensor histidine kinase [bacterium]|nr:HAMP domain-containing sensor histidine kinase [bacterium]
MKRLRIVQQIIIVILFAVIVPFVTIGLIISNVSQQSVRRELNYGVTSIAKYMANSIQQYILSSDKEFSYIASALKNMPTAYLKNRYLKEIEFENNKYTNLDIIRGKLPMDDDFAFNPDKKTVKLYAKIEDNFLLSGELYLVGLDEDVNNNTKNFMQSIFIFDDKMFLVATNNHSVSDLDEVIKALPKNREEDAGVLFSKIKNQPLAYYQLSDPDWTVVVMTNPSVTRNTIDKARGKIILCLLIAAGCILFAVGLYTYYLYINIRQLFKGITAISKGSYDRKIRLLKSVFTPHEVVFLEKEFNYMTQKISQAYTEISEKNLELKRLNEYRDSLVSAISHEFRTPLTSIIGYSGRLMRQDIVLDEDMKQKSLHIIKQQAQRLSRMVDDLLTIPDIESFHLSISPEFIDLAKIFELCSVYSNTANAEFKIEIEENLNKVYADYDRLIQIVVNLCDNAVKYNLNNAPIEVSIKNTDTGVEFKISNESEKIPDDMLDKLCDKFIRLDSELTRTTRGTGLGLYIVKGLCDAMDIDTSVKYENGRFVVSLNFKSRDDIEVG